MGTKIILIFSILFFFVDFIVKGFKTNIYKSDVFPSQKDVLPHKKFLQELVLLTNKQKIPLQGSSTDETGVILEAERESGKNVFVCTNVWCTERGSLATLSTLVGLAAGRGINVQGVSCLGKCKQGPNVRCEIKKDLWLDFSGIDSVDLAHKIMVDYMGVNVGPQVAQCLDLNLKGNYHLSKNEVSRAISFYTQALEVGRGTEQEGVVVLMRGTAHLQRALSHRYALEKAFQDSKGPAFLSPGLIELIFKELTKYPAILGTVIAKMAFLHRSQDILHQTFNFKIKMHRYSAYQACEDAIQATKLLPNFPQCWIRAGEVYTELGMFKQAEDHYKVALSLSESLKRELDPVLEKLIKEKEYSSKK